MRRPNQKVILTLLPLLLLSSLASYRNANSQTAAFTGKVVGVSDGDTIKVMREGQAVKVRLHGIDCPEKGQSFGTRAKRFTSDMAFAKEVIVRVKTTDRYGRIVGVVILPGGKNLNWELVDAGLAWWYRRYAPDDGMLERLEAEARETKRGLWGDNNPIPPWEWRRIQRGRRKK
jgi:endonuclease YncB( thermonuclease family)